MFSSYPGKHDIEGVQDLYADDGGGGMFNNSDMDYHISNVPLTSGKLCRRACEIFDNTNTTLTNHRSYGSIARFEESRDWTFLFTRFTFLKCA